MTYPVQLLEDSDRPLGNIIAQPRDSLVYATFGPTNQLTKTPEMTINLGKTHETWPLKMNMDSSMFSLVPPILFN